jgi:hypothetical protein
VIPAYGAKPRTTFCSDPGCGLRQWPIFAGCQRHTGAALAIQWAKPPSSRPPASLSYYDFLSSHPRCAMPPRRGCSAPSRKSPVTRLSLRPPCVLSRLPWHSQGNTIILFSRRAAVKYVRSSIGRGFLARSRAGHLLVSGRAECRRFVGVRAVHHRQVENDGLRLQLYSCVWLSPGSTG